MSAPSDNKMKPEHIKLVKLFYSVIEIEDCRLPFNGVEPHYDLAKSQIFYGLGKLIAAIEADKDALLFQMQNAAIDLVNQNEALQIVCDSKDARNKRAERMLEHTEKQLAETLAKVEQLNKPTPLGEYYSAI